MQRRLYYRSLCFWDIEYFATRITPRWTAGKKSGVRYPVPPFHKELWSVCMEGDDVVVVVPRGFSKTSAVTKVLSLWFLLFQLEPSILVVSSQGLGEVIIGEIRKELEENKLIRFIWGQLVPVENKHTSKLEKWRQKELQLLNGTEIKTASKGQAIRGQRPTLIIIDDPEENKDVKNPIIAAEYFNWVFTTLHNALDESGRMLVLGTIISANCFINTLKQQAKERSFRVLEYPAILNFDETKIRKGQLNGDSHYFFDEGIGIPLFPGKWSIPKLEIKYNKIGHKAFMQEFMHIPLILNGSPVFDENYTYTIMKPIDTIKGFDIFRPLTWETFNEAGEKILDAEGNPVLGRHVALVGIDFADGGADGDYSVITIRNEKFELLAQYRGKIAQDILAKMLDEILVYFDDAFIVPENNKGLVFINEAKQYEWFTKIYRQVVMDQVTNKQSEKVGFNTNAKTKPLIINEFDQLLRLGGWEVSSVEYEEILHYYHDEKGAMNAMSPWHDDTVISDALCVQAVNHGVIGTPLTFL